MEILRIILTVMGVLAYSAMSFLAVSAWCRMRELQRNLCNAQETLMKMFSVISTIKLQIDLEHLGRMERTLKDLIACEKFEEAQRMSEAITKIRDNVQGSIRLFNELFGDFAHIQNEEP